MIVDFGNNIVICWSLPKPLGSWFSCCNHESTGDIRLATDFLILQHQADIDFCILRYLYPELRIVKPPVIALWLRMVSNLLKQLLGLVSSCLIKTYRAPSSVCLSSPLRLYWIHLPTLRKYFINHHLFELYYKVSETHPPRTIWFLCLHCVFDIFFDSFEFFPIISLFAKRTSPYSFVSPGVSNSNKFEVVFWEISHIHNGVVMILKYALLPLVGFLEASLFSSINSRE